MQSKEGIWLFKMLGLKAYDDINDKLDDTINDIFYEFQSHFQIFDGHLEPQLQVAIDSAKETLIDAIINGMQWQYDNN